MTRPGQQIAIAGALVLGLGAATFARTSSRETLAQAVGTQAGSAAVQYLPSDKVQAAFAKGMPLIETDKYKVQASRRERDGEAEVHARDTDIMYFLEGTATVVTGGQVVNSRTLSPDEQRGESISGGDARHLVKGDIIVIPAGVPHMFKDVHAPVLYYTIKVTAPK
jgi:mannose-6-phosphate isomerase-like protein (cupin superfamily)